MNKPVNEALAEMQDSVTQIVKSFEKAYGLVINEISFSSLTFNNKKSETTHVSIGSYKTYDDASKV